MRPMFAALLLLAVMTAPAHAYDHKYAAEFLNIGVGARAGAMGGAFSAVADDASAGYWNPAGLRLLPRTQIGIMHSAQFGNEIKYDYLVFGSPGQGESFGVSLIRMGIDDIPYTDHAFNDWGRDNLPPGSAGDDPTDETQGNGQWDPYDPLYPNLPGEGIDESAIAYKSDVEMALLVSYAKTMGALSVGANAKLVRQGIGDANLLGLGGDDSMFGFGVDVGALYQVRPWWRAAGVLRDAVGTLLVWNNGTRNTKTPTLTLGNAFLASAASRQLMLIAAVDVDLRFENRQTASQFSSGALSADLRVGAEAMYREAIALRAGLQPSSKDSEPYGRAWDLTLGAGLAFRGLMLDYAFTQHPVFDQTHKVSLGLHL
ncbi:UPF0164 family protein [Candidatus Fermentibacteria bacterium]|nr:UPF0164 family protein [Candidatus Fermentibacteria bacterium]